MVMELMLRLRHLSLFFLLLPLILLIFRPVLAAEFVFNGFNASDNLLLYGDTTEVSFRTLTLTSATAFTIGRALYRFKVPTGFANNSSSRRLLPFYTSFIFSIAPKKGRNSGHGLSFLFAPTTGIEGTSSAQHLGLFNRTNDGRSSNHVFAIEFDVFENPEFNDINDNHVGVDVNSLTSRTSHTAGYWRDRDGVFRDLKLNNGENYQVWVDYVDFRLNVTMAPVGVKRPMRALISYSVNLSDVLLDEMYVGFAASTGQLVQTHRILGWCFSNSNSSVSERLVTTNLPSFVVPGTSVFKSNGFIVGITVGVVVLMCCVLGVFLFLVKRKKRKRKEREGVEEWELEYWPHRISYNEIEVATKGFGSENVIGLGGHGRVYKGVMAGGVEVAVKLISNETEVGMREFVAEVSSLGRLKHRNLVGLRGWCKREKGSLFLVYDYMENGSLDKRVFECEENVMLSWEDRIRILKDVAQGVLYLHEGWEAKVLHRDIKASNVLLDKDMNGRLGDFGLARIHGHGQVASTTKVVGTVGYMAPEVLQSGRASAPSDVFGFGVLILEVSCGRRPIENGKTSLIDWVWGLMEKGELMNALDERLRAKGGLDYEQVEMVLHLGLLCAYPDPRVRPTMRQVVRTLERTPGLYESEEGMEVSLLEKMKSTAMWSKYSRSLGYGGHPTFQQIRQSCSCSTSLSTSDIIMEGR